jgi:hypothetical protein
MLKAISVGKIVFRLCGSWLRIGVYVMKVSTLNDDWQAS